MVLSPVNSPVRRGGLWSGCKRRPEASPTGQEDAAGTGSAKRRLLGELPQLGVEPAGTDMDHDPGRRRGSWAFISAEGRRFAAPENLFVHACAEADRQGRASPRDVQTSVPADVLEYMMSCLTSKGTVEGRQDVADNVALLCAAEVRFQPNAPRFHPQRACPSDGPWPCQQVLKLPADPHLRPLLRTLAHQVWGHARYTGSSSLHVLSQLNLSAEAQQHVALILTTCC